MKHYIETEIIPQYEAFDKAHRTDHVRQVISESLKLASYYEVDKRMVYTIAACPDIARRKGASSPCFRTFDAIRQTPS